MRILEITPQLTFDGGAERFVVDLCNELSRTNTVILLTLYQPIKFPNYRDYLSPNIKTIFLNKKKGLDILLISQIGDIIKREKPDIVHTHCRAISYVALSMLKYHKFIKFIHTVHNDAFFEGGNGLNKLLRKFLFKNRYCTPVTISRNGENSFEKCYGFKPFLVENGRNIVFKEDTKITQEIEQFRITLNTKIFINVARIESQKNQTLLCKAFDSLVKKGYDIQLLIIGGLFNSEMVNEINSLGCNRIHLLGIKESPLTYMRLCDAFCLSSKIEGMPISLIEAFAAGLIPICTAVGGINDMIKDGYNGILSTGFEISNYAEALTRYLSLNKSDLNILKKNVASSFEYYTIEKCAESYIKIMQGNE